MQKYCVECQNKNFKLVSKFSVFYFTLYWLLFHSYGKSEARLGPQFMSGHQVTKAFRFKAIHLSVFFVLYQFRCCLKLFNLSLSHFITFHFSFEICVFVLIVQVPGHYWYTPFVNILCKINLAIAFMGHISNNETSLQVQTLSNFLTLSAKGLVWQVNSSSVVSVSNAIYLRSLPMFTVPEANTDIGGIK